MTETPAIATMLCGFVPGVSIVDEPAAAADPPAGDDEQQVPTAALLVAQ